MNTQQRGAFTLVELLTVVVIITILASLSLVALTGSMQTAKEMKTYGTIQKLDAAMLPIFESYEQRFENILDELETTVPLNTLMQSLNARQVVQLKLHLIHDLMRMEMPAYWNEVASFSGGNASKCEPIAIRINNIDFKVKEPPVLDLYCNALGANPSAEALSQGSAELLFLIIANLNPEALEGFGGTEIADTNNNGLMEFVDAWGKPIYFLRAAPGFSGSDRQPDIVRMAGLNLGPISDRSNTSLWSPTPDAMADDSEGSLVDAYRKARERWRDPFDPGAEVGRSWFLYPVIVSAGRDGIFDLAYGRLDNDGGLKTPAVAADVNPFDFATGIPEDKNGDGVLNHYDNIHNHRAPGGF